MKYLLLTASIACLGCVATAVAHEQPTKKEPITLGVAMSLTPDGGVTQLCRWCLNGVRAAVKAINDAGGINGQTVRVVVKDTKMEETDAVAAITALINEYHVSVVIGDLMSSTNRAMAPIARSNHVVLLWSGSEEPALSTPGGYLYRYVASESCQGRIMAAYAAKKWAQLPILIIVQHRKDSLAAAAGFETQARKTQNIDLHRIEFEQPPSDWNKRIEEVKQSDDLIVFVSADAENTGKILKTLKKKHQAFKWMSNLTVSTEEAREFAGTAVDGVIYAHPIFDPDSNRREVKAFVKTYQRQFHQIPHMIAAHGYDAVQLLSEVMKKYGTTRQQINDGLIQIRGFRGLTGGFSYDKNGEDYKSMAIMKKSNGIPVMIEEFELER